MHFEFKKVIEDSIKRASLKLGEQYGYSFSQDELNSLDIQVAMPPLRSEGLLSTNISFLIAAYINERLGQASSQPIEVAECLVAEINKLPIERNSSFVFKIGGPGYINAELSAREEYKLLAFYSADLAFPLLSMPYELKSHKDKGDKEYVEQYKKYFAKWWDFIRWEKELPKELLSVFDKFYVDGVLELSARLQFLALMGNEELDYQAYLNNIGGKENIKWYLERFKCDVEPFIVKLNSSKDCSPSENNLDFSLWCQKAIDLLLRARYEFYSSQQHRDPVRLMQCIIASVDSFYRYYNHPSFRSLDLTEGQCKIVRNMTKSISVLVSNGLYVLS